MNINGRFKHIIHNNSGSFPIIETLVTVGVSVLLLTVYFTSTIELYDVYDRPDADLNAKSVGVLEKLLSSPGQGSNYSLTWEDAPSNMTSLGLGTSPTKLYGILQITDEGEIIVLSQHSFSSRIGPVEMSFLANTKILMSDGSYKNVEDIVVGDKVRSYDMENNELVNGRVNRVFHFSSEEMTDYYLILNGVLKVTSNHQFYSNGEWVCAGDLKIGDILYQPFCEYAIYSIDRIFEKQPTYDLEIDVYHNYFVSINKTDLLVHNANEDPPPQSHETPPLGWFKPTAEFTWFDYDGPGDEKKVFFDASDSSFWSGEKWYTWWFNWDYDPSNGNYIRSTTNGQYEQYPVEYPKSSQDVTFIVRLLVNDSWGNDSIVKVIQVNTAEYPSINPFIEDYTNIYPEMGEQTTMPYDKNYYVEYTDLAVLFNSSSYDGYYLYEIKEKTNSPSPIVDYEKINSLMTVNYYDAKTALGFSTPEYSIYNFNIELIRSDDNEPLIPSYGAQYDDPESVIAMYSSSREVLIYHKPNVKSLDNIEEPRYENGRLIVRLFIGGEVPNYPPFTPRNPNPQNYISGVPWNAILSWIGGDPYGDIMKYDVYFGTSSSPTLKSYNQTGTTFNPGSVLPLGLMNPVTTYYWRILAKDPYNASASGPIWEFQTAPNTAPYTPANPNPKENETYISVTGTVLSWTGGDPDVYMGDFVKYNVFFGSSDECSIIGSPDVGVTNSTINLPLKAQGLSAKYWEPAPDGRLEYNTTYYWKILAIDRWGLSTFSPIWNFTTKQKGLDQLHTEGSDKGCNTTDFYRLGQSFTAGMTGNLTNIELSLKCYAFIPQPDEDITVELYRYHDIDIQGELLAETTIPSFDDYVFSWKNVVFNNSIPVQKGQKFLIVVNHTERRRYSWQYNALGPDVGVGSDSGSGIVGGYLDGEAYESLSGKDWKKFDKEVEDFLFKTYVFRDPILDQFCIDQTDEGYSTTGDLDLAQSFRASRDGDLMKVNLSLIWAGGPPPGDIIVSIYNEHKDRPGIPDKELGNSTISNFNSTKFTWTEINFKNENIPYLTEGELYFIVISTDPGNRAVIGWEMNNDEGCYPEGNAMQKQKIDPWETIVKLPFDFMFLTYMDDIG